MLIIYNRTNCYLLLIDNDLHLCFDKKKLCNQKLLSYFY